MTRHLLPNEIDLLLDEEGGFGLAPLRAHVQECADCRARLDEAQAVVDVIEAMPHFAPSHRLADRIMADVPVFEPWHVAARDTLVGWMPASRPLRVLALAGATGVATTLTAGSAWLLTRGDVVRLVTGMGAERLRFAVADAMRELVVGLLGPQAITAVSQVGAIGIAVGAGGALMAATGTVVGLRALAARRQG